MSQTETAMVVSADVGYDTCYGCGKCTSGCPMADKMDVQPHQAMRLLQMREAEELVDASAPWECIGCQTCLARCPNRVDIPLAFAELRNESMRRGAPGAAGTIPLFEDLLLHSVRKRGRMNDSMLVAKYKMKTGQMFSDLGLGLKMILAGKFKLFGTKVSDIDSVRSLFRDDEEGK